MAKTTQADKAAQSYDETVKHLSPLTEKYNRIKEIQKLATKTLIANTLTSHDFNYASAANTLNISESALERATENNFLDKALIDEQSADHETTKQNIIKRSVKRWSERAPRHQNDIDDALKNTQTYHDLTTYCDQLKKPVISQVWEQSKQNRALAGHALGGLDYSSVGALIKKHNLPSGINEKPSEGPANE